MCEVVVVVFWPELFDRNFNIQYYGFAILRVLFLLFLFHDLDSFLFTLVVIILFFE